jgi:hypothetical protein
MTCERVGRDNVIIAWMIEFEAIITGESGGAEQGPRDSA